MKILILTEAPSVASNLTHEEFLKLARSHFSQPGPFMEEVLRRYETAVDELTAKGEEVSDKMAVVDELREKRHQFVCPTCGAPLELDLEIPSGD